MLYNNRDVFGKPKQLIVGKSGTNLAIGKAGAKAAGISSCILKQTGPGAGKFERNIFAFNAAGEEVKLATFGIDDDGDKTVEPCSDAALTSVVRLGLKLKGHRQHWIYRCGGRRPRPTSPDFAPVATPVFYISSLAKPQGRYGSVISSSGSCPPHWAKPSSPS